MMKKILVLLLVLGMASWAHAGLINVVMTGYDDNDGSGDITASDIVYIAIALPDGVSSDGYDLDLHVSGPGALQEVNGGPGPNHAAGIGMWEYSGIANNGIAQMAEVHLMGTWIGQDLIWGLAIHCEGRGNVLVDLTLNGGTRADPEGGNNWQNLTEADLGDLTIVQVPEPMTIALLGLGSLLALRRRK
jgi:hypothetical protein